MSSILDIIKIKSPVEYSSANTQFGVQEREERWIGYLEFIILQCGLGKDFPKTVYRMKFEF